MTTLDGRAKWRGRSGRLALEEEQQRTPRQFGEAQAERERRQIIAHPAKSVGPISLLLVGAFLAIVPALASSRGLHTAWHTPWYLNAGDYYMMIGGAATILYGILVGACGRARPRHSVRVVDLHALEKAQRILFRLYIFGTALFVASAVLHGLTFIRLLHALEGRPDGAAIVNASTQSIPGLTTFTEVGPVLSACLVLCGKLGSPHNRRLAIVIAINAIRAFANSERLSLIEVILPAVIVWALVEPIAERRQRGTRFNRAAGPATSGAAGGGRRRAVTLLLLLSPGLLLLFFAATEYGRSWASHYRGLFRGNLIQFSIDRVWAYYATASNNGVVYAHYLRPQLHVPRLTLDALQTFPPTHIILKLVGLTNSSDVWSATLRTYADPQYNNPSTFLPLMSEIGIPLALLLFAAWGFALGKLYTHAISGSAVGICAYAGFAVALLELPRYPYLCNGRAVAGLVAVLIIAIVCRSEPATTDTEALAATTRTGPRLGQLRVQLHSPSATAN